MPLGPCPGSFCQIPIDKLRKDKRKVANILIYALMVQRITVLTLILIGKSSYQKIRFNVAESLRSAFTILYFKEPNLKGRL